MSLVGPVGRLGDASAFLVGLGKRDYANDDRNRRVRKS